MDGIDTLKARYLAAVAGAADEAGWKRSAWGRWARRARYRA